jgi:hypothetical protein
MERHCFEPRRTLTGRLAERTLTGLTVLALIVVPISTGHAALQLDVMPAWDGHWRPGAATEITLGLLSEVGGPIRISVAGGDIKTVTHTVLEPDVSLTVTLPIRPGAAAIELAVTFADQEEFVQTIDLYPRTERVAAIVAANFPASSAMTPPITDDLTQIPLSASALPRNPEAYEAIDLLVLDYGVLGRLDDWQRKALELFAANCGHIEIRGPIPAEPAFSLKQPRCIGDQPSSATIGLNVVGPLRKLPGTNELRELTVASSGIWPLVFFFSGYALVLLIFGTTRQRPVAMLSLPVMAALLLVVAVWDQSAKREFIFWAELVSGARVGRYTALLDIRGRGPGGFESMVPVELGLPVYLAGGGPLKFEYRLRQPTNVLTVHPHLLSRHQFTFTSAMEFVVPLTLTLSEDKPWIQNTSELRSPAATLAWQGRYFSVPPLDSGQRWSPASDTPRIAASHVPNALRRQTLDQAAVLLGLTSDQVPAPESEVVNAWLLLRPRAAERSS